MSEPTLENRKVFIGNIPYSASTTDIRQHMEQAGAVLRVELFKDELGYSRGCGIIEYTSRHSACAAVSQLNQSSFGQRMITVKFDDSSFSAKKNQSSPCALSDQYVIRLSNMPLSVTWQQVKDVCREIGNVMRVDIFQDEQKKSTGEAIAVFNKAEEAQEAIRLLNGAIFNDRYVKARLDTDCTIR